MKRIDNPELKRKIIDHLADLYKIREVRDPNHLSSYITCRTKSFLDQKQTADPTDQEVLLFALGYGLQDVLTPPDASAPVIEKNGIIYRPDMILSNRLNEVKTTRKSAKYHYLDDALPVTWIEYMLGGCYMMDTVEYDLIILYMMGNYSPPFPDIYAETEQFSQDEIQDNWIKILQNKTVLDTALLTGVPPEPFKNCYEWECKYCRYQLVCQTLTRDLNVKMTVDQAEEDKELWA
ncbi:hypothetical protein LCGC14_2560000 [marine sediment metagenome]|uniref:PD-(D/E)XK endonuclease-like domain-containing protein n=1 Tax=marine sediment metagenome TaxID=412755 RepID=A0A0F9AK94_9ZZZZ